MNEENEEIINEEDINKTYTLSELLYFFDLKKENLTRKDIEDRSSKLLDKSLDNDYSDEENIKKISFIFKIKKSLLKYLENESTNFILEKVNQENKKNILVSDQPHFIQKTDNIDANYLNPLDITYKLKNLVFNSLYCDENLKINQNILDNPDNSLYTFTLPQKIKDVIGIKLKAVQYPNVQYTISPKHNNNQLYIKVNGTGIQGLIKVPYGKYFASELAPVLQKQINLILYPNKPANYTVFTVIYEINISKYVIKNTKNQNFTIYFDKSEFYENPEAQLAQCGYVPYRNLNGFYENYNSNNNVLFVYTLGAVLGFQHKVYYGNNTYISESFTSSDLEQYYYFSLNDYNYTRIDDISAVLGKTMQQNNILGVIPITADNRNKSSFGNIILDTGSNYIFRSRNYTGPVDIEKIQVSYYGPDFSLLDLSENNFMFIIEFKILYENSASNKEKDKKIAFKDSSY